MGKRAHRSLPTCIHPDPIPQVPHLDHRRSFYPLGLPSSPCCKFPSPQTPHLVCTALGIRTRHYSIERDDCKGSIPSFIFYSQHAAVNAAVDTRSTGEAHERTPPAGRRGRRSFGRIPKKSCVAQYFHINTDEGLERALARTDSIPPPPFN